MTMIHVLAVLFSTIIMVDANVRNISSLALPLVDRMEASLTANIDISDMKSVLKDYIDQVVKEQVLASLDETVKRIVSSGEEIQSEIQTSLKVHETNMTDRITNLSKDIITAELGKLQSVSDQNKNDIELVIKENQEAKKNFESYMTKGRNKCAFFAALKAGISNIPDREIVPFSDVKLNTGGCYSGSSSKFTANEDGLFVFSWTTLSSPKKDFTSVLVRDGVVLGKIVVDSDSVSDAMTGSMTVVVELKSGDSVWVQVADNEGKHIRGKWGTIAPVSVFCGYKILTA